MPEAFDNIATGLDDLAHQGAEGRNNARNDLRHSLTDFHDDGGQVLNQGHKQLNTGHDDLVDVPDEGVDNTGDDLRDRLNDCRYNLRQGLNQ